MAFSEDCIPSKTGLSTLENEKFEKHLIIVGGSAPFGVMVVEHELIGWLSPRTSMERVRHKKWAVAAYLEGGLTKNTDEASEEK